MNDCNSEASIVYMTHDAFSVFQPISHFMLSYVLFENNLENGGQKDNRKIKWVDVGTC